LYLAVVLDLFSRRVVGWSMGPTLERTLVISALDMALAKRQPSAGLLCHSDRGSQYQSGDYQAQLKEAGIVCSLSRKGNCWDGGAALWPRSGQRRGLVPEAPTESFFASLKRELVHRTRFASHRDAKVAIFDWIEVWYNRKRRHSSLGYVSPEAFERQYQQQLQGAMAA
jgi:putative transposase